MPARSGTGCSGRTGVVSYQPIVRASGNTTSARERPDCLVECLLWATITACGGSLDRAWECATLAASCISPMSERATRGAQVVLRQSAWLGSLLHIVSIHHCDVISKRNGTQQFKCIGTAFDNPRVAIIAICFQDDTFSICCKTGSGGIVSIGSSDTSPPKVVMAQSLRAIFTLCKHPSVSYMFEIDGGLNTG
jgi:hypothetical protein